MFNPRNNSPFGGRQSNTSAYQYQPLPYNMVGTQANGSVLFTTVGAAMRGFKVVVPIDTLPADTAYQEQLAIWEIANAPGIAGEATLTRTDMLKF